MNEEEGIDGEMNENFSFFAETPDSGMPFAMETDVCTVSLQVRWEEKATGTGVISFLFWRY